MTAALESRIVEGGLSIGSRKTFHQRRIRAKLLLSSVKLPLVTKDNFGAISQRMDRAVTPISCPRSEGSTDQRSNVLPDSWHVKKRVLSQ
jgi:hypothetical protein